MGIEIKVRDKLFESITKEIIADNRRKLERFMPDAINTIEDRVAKGLDVNGRKMITKSRKKSPFSNYSEGYAEFKKSTGRQYKRIDLEFTGGMLGALQSDVKRDRNAWIGRIYFSGKSNVDKARKTDKMFNWFGLSKKQFKKLNNLFRGRK